MQRERIPLRPGNGLRVQFRALWLLVCPEASMEALVRLHSGWCQTQFPGKLKKFPGDSEWYNHKGVFFTFSWKAFVSQYLGTK